MSIYTFFSVSTRFGSCGLCILVVDIACCSTGQSISGCT